MSEINNLSILNSMRTRYGTAWIIFCFILMSCPKKPPLSEEQKNGADILIAKSVDSTHNSVIAILRVDTVDNVVLSASGVLINPRVILTAGHVNFKNAITFPNGCRPHGIVSFSRQALTKNDRYDFD